MICMTPTAKPLSLASGETEHFAGNAKASPTGEVAMRSIDGEVVRRKT